VVPFEAEAVGGAEVAAVAAEAEATGSLSPSGSGERCEGSAELPHFLQAGTDG
jgi:hypothetical protein